MPINSEQRHLPRRGSDVFDVMFWGAAVAARAANIRPGGSITFTIGGLYYMNIRHISDNVIYTGAVVVRPVKGWTLGAALTGAVDSFTRALAVDIAPIRVNVVSPGLVKTEVSTLEQLDQIRFTS